MPTLFLRNALKYLYTVQYINVNTFRLLEKTTTERGVFNALILR